MNDPFRRIPIRFRRFLFAAALGGIAFVSLWSHDNLEAHVSADVQSKDYLIHFTCYFLLEACCLWAWARRSAPRRSRAASALFCVLYGAAMELLQTLPAVGRSCSLSDFRQNALGALLAALLVPSLFWPGERRSPPLP